MLMRAVRVGVVAVAMAAVLAGGSAMAQGFAKNVLRSGEMLKPGEYLQSNNRTYRLEMQENGNLVLMQMGGKRPKAVLWQTGTEGKATAGAAMQQDGTFVLRGPNGKAHWMLGADAGPGAWLKLRNDGNMVVYERAPVWQSGTDD